MASLPLLSLPLVLEDLATVALVVAAVVLIRRARRTEFWGEAMRRLARNRLAMIALAVLGLYAAVGVLDSIAWREPGEVASKSIIDRVFGRPPERTYSAPFARHTMGERHPHPLKGWHVLGTDGLGNDVFYMTLKGARTALIIGGLTTLFAIVFAVPCGIAAGYFGGWVDDVVQYVYSTLASIPDILLLVALLMMIGRGILQICIALGVTSWVGLCRLLRGETLKHREKEYVMAARALGVSPLKILWTHILPNVLHIVLISATLGFSGLVLNEAILDYIGVGVQPGTGSWGNMIDSARMELARDPLVWWNLAGAAIGLFFLVLAANVFGDAVRDALDPRLRAG